MSSAVRSRLTKSRTWFHLAPFWSTILRSRSQEKDVPP